MRWLPIVALVLPVAAAQEMPTMKPVVSMAPAPVITVTQGKAAPVPLSFRVARGYHINSYKPKSEFLIPTALKIGATTDIVIGGATHPDGPDVGFAFPPDENINLFNGRFYVDVSGRPRPSAHPRQYI